jgi:peroxiredoxin
VEDLLFDLRLIPLGGETPPAFTLESLDGKKVSLSDYRGKPVFLYFWASW